MPTLSLLGWSDGAGKNWETATRTRNAVAYEDPVVLLGEPYQPSYTALAATISIATSADHVIEIMADGTLYTRIKRIYVEQVVGATTATLARLQILRISTAGTGGTAVTARPYDAADTYAGTAMTLPTVKGTEGNIILQKRLQILTTAQVAATTTNPNSWEWLTQELKGIKPIIIGPAVTDGIALKIITGIATATVDVTVEFTTDTAL